MINSTNGIIQHSIEAPILKESRTYLSKRQIKAALLAAVIGYENEVAAQDKI